MTRIWVLSDLHTEVAGMTLTPPDADFCIAAGDIARGGEAHVEWLKAHVAPHMPVISVLGNHEFYRGSLEQVRIDAGRASAQGDVHVLDDMTWTESEVRFIGATLWTDFSLYGEATSAMEVATRRMNDFRLIGCGGVPFTPAMAQGLYMRSLDYLQGVLSVPFDGDTVVVTHHSPSPHSVHSEYGGDPLNAAFSSDLEWLIEKFQPSVWIHGHTHHSFSYEIGETRVICNPRGYGGENKAFDPSLVIEVGEYRPRMRP